MNRIPKNTTILIVRFTSLLCALLATAMLTAQAAEKKKITWSTKFGPVLQRSEVKVANHVMSLQTRQDLTTSADPDWDGAVFVVSGTANMADGSGPISGCGTRTHRNGDQSFICYEGVSKRNGDAVAAEGTVTLLGGTGKFANIKGSGTFAGTATGATVTAEIEY